MLVDDLSLDKMLALHGDGVRTSAEILTSPGNIQAWIRVADRKTHFLEGELRQIARYIAHTYGGDLRSAKPSQLGRLAGFRNRKEKHKNEQNEFPIVAIRRAVFTGVQHDVVERAKSFVLPPSPPSARSASVFHGSTDAIMKAPITERETEEVWIEVSEELTRDFGMRYLDDRSRFDHALAARLRSNGMSPEDAAKLLMLNSAKAKDRGAQYVRQTILAAFDL